MKHDVKMTEETSLRFVLIVDLKGARKKACPDKEREIKLLIDALWKEHATKVPSLNTQEPQHDLDPINLLSNNNITLMAFFDTSINVGENRQDFN